MICISTGIIHFYPEALDPDKRYTKIRYIVTADKKVELSIYNIIGERIKTLDFGDKTAKVVYTADWDGKQIPVIW